MPRGAAFALAHRIAYSGWFQNLVVGVIVANAITIGITTYELDEQTHHVIEVLDRVFLGVFVVELVLKLMAYRLNLKAFFSNGWNVFDLVVVVAAFMPGLSNNSTALRMVRLLRVTRLIKLMPDVGVLLHGLRRAAGPAMSLLALTTLLVYLYAVVGWILFHDKVPEDKPQYFANIGESMLTLFELLTLEGWNSTMHDLRFVHPLALPYILSFLFVGTYIVINLVVGVVITSLDEAYQARRREAELAKVTADGPNAAAAINELRDIVERLELHLEAHESAARKRAEEAGLPAAFSSLPGLPRV